MSCAMIYWGKHFERFFAVFKRFGAVVDLSHLRGKQFGEGCENNQLQLLEVHHV